MRIIHITLNRIAMQKRKHQARMTALTSGYDADCDLPLVRSCDDVASQCFFSTLNSNL